MSSNYPPSVTEISKKLREELGNSVSQKLITEKARKIQKKVAMHLPLPKQAVINATGVLIHTNLGRSPLGEYVLSRLHEKLKGSIDLEIDLKTNERGGRTAYLDALMSSVQPHLKSSWVNNNAAGVLLALNTLKKHSGLSKMIISRGELVEIGGGFRVPEIMKESGFEVIEVGTTNKTRFFDYAQALQKERAIICKVHPSNFKMQGFVEETSLKDLEKLATEFSVPLIYDAGTLDIDDIKKLSLALSIVTLSTDKTLGGPQGGLILSQKIWHEKIITNPLYRALRLDKLSLVALEAVLELHIDKKDRKHLPLSQMRAVSDIELRKRATQLVSNLSLKNFTVQILKSHASFGGGSWPGETLPSYALVLKLKKGDFYDKASVLLRQQKPAVMAIIRDKAIWFDLRTVLEGELADLKQAILKLDEKLIS